MITPTVDTKAIRDSLPPSGLASTLRPVVAIARGLLIVAAFFAFLCTLRSLPTGIGAAYGVDPGLPPRCAGPVATLATAALTGSRGALTAALAAARLMLRISRLFRPYIAAVLATEA